MEAVVGVVALGLADFPTMFSLRDLWLSKVEANGGIWGELVESWGGMVRLFGAAVEIDDLMGESSDGCAGVFVGFCLCLRRVSLTWRVANFFFSLTQEFQSRFQNSSKLLVVALGYCYWIPTHFSCLSSRTLSSGNIS